MRWTTCVSSQHKLPHILPKHRTQLEYKRRCRWVEQYTAMRWKENPKCVIDGLGTKDEKKRESQAHTHTPSMDLYCLFSKFKANKERGRDFIGGSNELPVGLRLQFPPCHTVPPASPTVSHHIWPMRQQRHMGPPRNSLALSCKRG